MVTQHAAPPEGSQTASGDRILDTAVPFRGTAWSALLVAFNALLRG